MNKLLISPSPHIHTRTSTASLMRDVVIALLPTVIVSILFYGWSEIIVLGVSILSCVLLEYLITRFLLNKLAKNRMMDELEENAVHDCIECGCCLYTCPANIPLLDVIRIAKGDVIKIIRGRQAAAKAAAEAAKAAEVAKAAEPAKVAEPAKK